MKSKITLSVMSLSLLMGTLPINADVSTYKEVRKDAGKAVRCSWHVAKISAGCVGSLLGGTLLAVGMFLRTNKASKLICAKYEIDDKAKLKADLKKMSWPVNGLALAILIPAMITAKKGYDDLQKELNNSEKDQENNKNKDEQSN